MLHRVLIKRLIENKKIKKIKNEEKIKANFNRNNINIISSNYNNFNYFSSTNN